VVQLIRRTEFAGCLIDAERFGPSLVVDLRLHGFGIEEDALARALGLHETGGHRHDREVGLGITLFEDARTEIGFAIAIHVLAVRSAGNCHVVVPGLGRLKAQLFQNVPTIVEHLEVTIDGDQIGLAADFLVVLAEVRGDVVEVDLVVVSDIVGQIFDQPAIDQLDSPA